LPDFQVARREPARVYFGTSDEMVTRAWKALDQGRYDLAIEQAEATIQEWHDWARKLQDRKARTVGDLLMDDGTAQRRQEIFSYWALNDVAAAYFIIGKAHDAQRDYRRAAQAFQQIVLHYSLAQIYDPRGWFWSPTDAITQEFVARDPDHYGAVIPQRMVAGYSQTGKQPN
jgi:hypothetical protein